MAAVKLVKNLFMVILFCAEMQHIKCMRTNNEEEPDAPAHTVYDQRQSGKYNIHVVIKDVAIIEMDQNEISDQNYSDEEYYYDEDEVTVKPFYIKTTSTSTKPIDSTGGNTTTIPQMHTNISAAENKIVETASKTPSSTLSVNVTTTSHKDSSNNNGDFITLVTTHRPAVNIKSRSKVEPIYANGEPALQWRHQLQDFNEDSDPIQAQPRDSNFFTNSKIVKVKPHRTNRVPKITQQRCRSFQYRDAKGNCRGRRTSSGSILKRLFRMLVTLPFEQDEQQLDD